MSDRDDRERRTPGAEEPEATLEELREDDVDEELDVGPPSPEPMPEDGNEDHGFEAAPPDDVTMQRTSDDNDLNPSGGGFTDTPIREEYESMARRDDMARRLEDLVADAREWAQEVATDEARDIAESLADIYERLGAPSEDTDVEPLDVVQAEPGELEMAGDDQETGDVGPPSRAGRSTDR